MANGIAFDAPATYRIRVHGLLEHRWADWFGGLTIEPQADDETLLTGEVADQSALYAMLLKIHNLGLPLLSVERVQT